MAWQQRIVTLTPRSRGFHLITHELEQALAHMEEPKVGLLHLFLQHTSASLSINENADPDVPYDLEMAFSTVAPEDLPYRHTCEGPDDMPAHIKTSMLGALSPFPLVQESYASAPGRASTCVNTEFMGDLATSS